MNIYNILEILRRLITWPVRLLVLPIFIVVALLLTNWNKESDREFTKEFIINLIKPI